LLSLLLASFLTLNAHAAIQGADTRTLVVNARILDPNNPARDLFTYDRVPKARENQLTVTYTYKDPSGSVVAQEQISYTDGKVSAYVVDQMQLGERGGFEVQGNRISFHYTKDGESKTSEETLDEPLVVGDSLVAFIHDHWDDLKEGRSLKVRMPVTDRRETFGFKFEREPDSMLDGKAVHSFKFSASSFFVRMAVKPLHIFLSASEKKPLVKITGRVFPKVKRDGKWEDLDTVSLFR